MYFIGTSKSITSSYGWVLHIFELFLLNIITSRIFYSRTVNIGRNILLGYRTSTFTTVLVLYFTIEQYKWKDAVSSSNQLTCRQFHGYIRTEENSSHSNIKLQGVLDFVTFQSNKTLRRLWRFLPMYSIQIS